MPPDSQTGETYPKLEHYSYFDKSKNLHAGNAWSKQIRIILIVFNIIFVAAAALTGLSGGFFIGTIGYPVAGIFFTTFMILAASVQFFAFDYRRVYGVWRGICPYCRGLLDISARQTAGKSVSCPMCKERVVFENQSFRPAPWYAL